MPVVGTAIEQRKEQSAREGKDGSKSRTRVFRVDTDNMGDLPSVVLAAVPSTSYDGIPMASKECKLVDVNTHGGHQYFVTVEYSWGDGGGSGSKDPAQQVEDPLARPQIVSYDKNEEQVTWFMDHTGDNGGAANKPYANSVGTPFEDLPVRQRTTGILTITRNKATFNHAAANAVKDRVNSVDATFNGIVYPAGTLLCSVPTAVKQYENGTYYWQVTTVIKVDDQGWDTRVNDRGTHDTTHLVRSGNGRIVENWPLDGAGNFQATEATPPAVLLFQPYRKMNFTDLNPFI